MLGRNPQLWQPGAAACALIFLIATPVKLCHFIPARDAEAARNAGDAQRGQPAQPDPATPKRIPIAVAATLPQVLPPRKADHESLRAAMSPSDDPHIRGAARERPPTPVAIGAGPARRDSFPHRGPVAPPAERDVPGRGTEWFGRAVQPTGPPVV